MIDKAAIEQQLAELPLFQYDWITTSELVFSERVRYICQTQCPMYNTTWACPPAVGTVEECKARCLSYPEALMMTSITEVSDIANLEETLATRAPQRTPHLHRDGGRRHLRHLCHPGHPRRARGRHPSGRGHGPGGRARNLHTLHRGLRHLPALRLPGRTVPSPRPNVPLRGEPGHSGHRPCRKARSGFYERQHRRLVLADPI